MSESRYIFTLKCIFFLNFNKITLANVISIAKFILRLKKSFYQIRKGQITFVWVMSLKVLFKKSQRYFSKSKVRNMVTSLVDKVIT